MNADRICQSPVEIVLIEYKCACGATMEYSPLLPGIDFPHACKCGKVENLSGVYPRLTFRTKHGDLVRSNFACTVTNEQ